MIVFSRLAFKEPITKPLGREKLGSQHASKDHDFRIVRSKAAEMSPSGVAFPINLISPQGMPYRKIEACTPNDVGQNRLVP